VPRAKITVIALQPVLSVKPFCVVEAPKSDPEEDVLAAAAACGFGTGDAEVACRDARVRSSAEIEDRMMCFGAGYTVA
jgi:hypothetical protein